MFQYQDPISIASPKPAVSQRRPIFERISSFRVSFVKYLLLVVGAVYLAASLYFMYFAYSVYEVRPRIDALEKKQEALETQQGELNKRVHARLSEFKQTLSSQTDETKQELAARAAELEQQKAAAARLSAAQSQQSKQLTAVSGEVSNVKSDVGAAKADIQKTQSELAATNVKLDRTVGDLGLESGLIAHNAQELEVLKHKGERNYFDIKLQKNTRVRVSTVSLTLKKVDPNKSTFTVIVMADDKTMEKKDRTLNEPLQFYTGSDRALYELVLFTAAKNSVSGYLSTPKSLPTSASR
ncbi:MAG TPA: hypothetical protein VMT39_01360 [Candidatus Bathyarchaeia archaeon]|nr:hypothetical protein [Candidatus Bathyarchaeia archaeon]